MAEKTLFDGIIAGEIPSHRIYEDDQVVAFLDIFPLSRGHALVVPRESRATLAALSDGSAAAIGRVLPRICRAVAAAAGTPDCNVLQNNGEAAGQAVPHVHFHVIPKFGKGSGPGSGLQKKWLPGTLSDADGGALAARIRDFLAEESARDQEPAT